MTTLRITIEIDMDNEAVQGRWSEHVKNSLATLARRIESDDNYPRIWPQSTTDPSWPGGWTEQAITAKVHPRGNERTTIGTFRVEQIESVTA